MKMRIKTMFTMALAAAMLAAGVAAQAASSEVSRIVTFDPGVSAAERAAAVEQAGGRVVEQLDLINGVEAAFPAFQTESFGMATLAKGRSGVESVELNKSVNWLKAVAPFGSLPTVSSFLRAGAAPVPTIGAAAPVSEASSKSSTLPWGIQRVDAPAAWSRTMGQGVRVGVIDTGIDYTHPALQANYKGGYNAITGSNDPKDDHGHGTHVAGTIAAASKDIVGVAPKASLYAIKVLDKNGNGTYADIIKGLQWAVKNHMQVVNMSLGGPSSDALKKAIDQTLAAGVVIVAAAGNDPNAPVTAPGMYPGVIAVSASTVDDQLAFFSSTGPQVAFIAPGYEITSTWLGGGTKVESGTSMATPHVAGLAALAVSLGASGPEGVRQALTNAASPLSGLTATQQGAGMIDA
ncbi:MAG: S8 family peptidase, partial [Elusimicrobia bacterium]|nr:S8 family peptidase [Elusimicrobiota bacterium]